MATTTDLKAVWLAELRRGRDAVLDSVPRLSPNFERPDHLPVEVAEFFVGVGRGEERRLVFSSAPRFGKSTLLVHGIAWAMFVRPGLKVGIVSCTAFLAEQLSRHVRTLLQQLGVYIGKEQRSVEMWQAANGSSLRACGIGTALVGIGFDLLVCDDLVPSMQAAQSEAERVHNEEWIESTALGRLEPNASVVVCMHRWSCDDISGRLISRGWPWVNLPAVDTRTGASNWPTRWSTQQLEAKRREVGPLVWEAMWLGTPSPRGGRVFGAIPTYYDPHEVVGALLSGAARIVIGVDPAFTARTSADYSVILIAAVTRYSNAVEYEVKEFIDPGRRVGRMVKRTRHDVTNVMNVLDVIRGQWEVPTTVERIALEQRRYTRWCSVATGVESVGGAKAIPQYLRRADPTMRVFDIKRTTDKLTASIPCSAAWHRGEVRLPPTNPPWLADALHEIQNFTGTGADAHDDVVDALTIAHQLVGIAEHEEQKRSRLAALGAALYGPRWNK
jgi:predicted phage terminase large subunit-like protein